MNPIRDRIATTTAISAISLQTRKTHSGVPATNEPALVKRWGSCPQTPSERPRRHFCHAQERLRHSVPLPLDCHSRDPAGRGPLSPSAGDASSLLWSHKGRVTLQIWLPYKHLKGRKNYSYSKAPEEPEPSCLLLLQNNKMQPTSAQSDGGSSKHQGITLADAQCSSTWAKIWTLAPRSCYCPRKVNTPYTEHTKVKQCSSKASRSYLNALAPVSHHRIFRLCNT